VELLLDGKSLGKKPTNRSTKFIAVWHVPFQPGTLKAVGYAGKKKVGFSELKSAGEPVNIKLSADRTMIRADGQDLSYISVELTDAAGIRNPKADNLVKFELDGPGTIVAVGNANPVSTESYQLPRRKAWHGRCMVIVKSGSKPGKITVKASSPGLETASIELFSN
jgi:beta-galactosidase